MKKRIFSLLLAICLVIPCAILMTACGTGSKKAFSVAGKTLKTTGNVQLVWKENVTDEEKEDYFKEYDSEDITTEQNVVDYLKKEVKAAKYKFKFEKSNTVYVTWYYENGDGEMEKRRETYFYSQSEDLTEIKLYNTPRDIGVKDYEFIIVFKDKHFQFVNGEDWNHEGIAAQCYLELKKK